MFIQQLIAYEEGEMTEEQVIAFFQDLVTSGEVWHLQGHYGRTAAELIKQGVVKAP